ncbi:MAG: DegT/DnrJ/EryC1/StrS family aminotransferase [Caldicoprobacterales bacterium]
MNRLVKSTAPNMEIAFSPPDISQEEINQVVETLQSGWITTGPKTKLFEKKIAEHSNTEKAACLSSATAAMEMTLRLLGIGEGDEVITSAYTYTASASIINHVGAKI